MNIIMADMQNIYLASIFNEDPDYFMMRVSEDAPKLIIASEKLPGAERWENIGNRTIRMFA
jgi:hypothetical protein